MSIEHAKREKIPRVPETLLKKRKKFQALKAERKEAARKAKKVIVFYHFATKIWLSNLSSNLMPFTLTSLNLT